MRPAGIGAAMLALVLASCSGQPAPTAPPAGVPLQARAQDGAFVLEIGAGRGGYARGEPIEVWTRLTYAGALPAFKVAHGDPLVSVSLEQLDGPFDLGGVVATVCMSTSFTSGQSITAPYVKSGAFDGDDPNAAQLRAFFDDPLVRPPAGLYRFTAVLDAFEGECGMDRPRHHLDASINVLVAP